MLIKRCSRSEFLPIIDQEVNNVFNQIFGKNFINSKSSRYPKIDVVENDKGLTIRAAVAGVAKEDLDVEVTPEKILVISGKMSDEYVNTSDHYYVRELSSSSFSRQIYLPENVEEVPVAKLDNGILTLEFNIIKPEIEEPKKIRIEIE